MITGASQGLSIRQKAGLQAWPPLHILGMLVKVWVRGALSSKLGNAMEYRSVDVQLKGTNTQHSGHMGQHFSH